MSQNENINAVPKSEKGQDQPKAPPLVNKPKKPRVKSNPSAVTRDRPKAEIAPNYVRPIEPVPRAVERPRISSRVEAPPAPIAKVERAPPLQATGVGRIVIRDTPPALIFVDGSLACRIPCSAKSLSFSAGTYELRAERVGFEPARQSVVVNANESTQIRFDLMPAQKIKLIFDWDTSNVDIRVTDASGVRVSRKKFGLNSDTIELPAGDYVLDLRQGSEKRQIRVSNPGGGKTRYVADPFAGGGL